MSRPIPKVMGMEPPSAISFDDTLWPLLIVKFTGTPTPQQFEDYLAKRSSYLELREKHVLIYDTQRFRVLTNEQRQRQVDWLKAREKLRQETVLGSAIIITSPIARLLMSTVLHFAPTKTPYHSASSMAVAVAWAAARLEMAGLSAEANRVRYHFAQFVNRSAD